MLIYGVVFVAWDCKPYGFYAAGNLEPTMSACAWSLMESFFAALMWPLGLLVLLVSWLFG